jgi:DNA-binding beta-propeller fold protein YncE
VPDTADSPSYDLHYRVVEGWERLPDGFTHLDCVGVGVGRSHEVFVLTRGQARVIVYDRDGRFLSAWGEGIFTERTHGLTVAPDETVYCVDEGAHCIYRFSPDGELLQTIGTPGMAAATGYDGSLASIVGGPPFNRPTNLAIAPSGELYVTDGYGNCKVHRFSPAGELIQSWGEPGTGPGEFVLPHGIAVDADGMIWVADRENDRLQRFDLGGTYLDEWTDVQRPTSLVFDARGNVFVSELAWRSGDRTPQGREIAETKSGRVSVFDRDGRLLARWSGAGTTAGNFVAPHDLAVDARGDVYVVEVTHTFGVSAGLAPPDAPSFQKFTSPIGEIPVV